MRLLDFGSNLKTRMLRKIVKAKFDPVPQITKNVSQICSLFPEEQRNAVQRDLRNFQWDGSWHYILFRVLLKYRDQSQKIDFLEIGTFDGLFVRFLAENFDGKFFTVDLHDDHTVFKSTYNRSNLKRRNEFIKQRNNNINKENIYFRQLDSFFLLDEFKSQRFDFIWVDGDHLNPQVSFDIFSAFHLLKNHGIFCVDDIFIDPVQKQYGSNESFITLESMRQRGLINVKYILKRVKYTNGLKGKCKHIAIVSAN